MDAECAEIVKTLLAEAKADALKAIAAERERAEKAEKECARLNELFALRWDATQSAETQAAVAAERERCARLIEDYLAAIRAVILADEQRKIWDTAWAGAVAGERERCAKIVEELPMPHRWQGDPLTDSEVREIIAVAIRKGE